ncbi:unnamed protein product, partial [marine sediment metagenome]
NLGMVYKIRGDLKAAEEMYKKALAIFTSIGNKMMIEKVKPLLDQLRDNK